MKNNKLLKLMLLAVTSLLSCEKPPQTDIPKSEVRANNQNRLIICEPLVEGYGIADPSNKLLFPLFSNEKWRSEKEVVLTNEQTKKLLSHIEEIPEEQAVAPNGYKSTAVIITTNGVPSCIIFSHNTKDYFLVSNNVDMLPGGLFAANQLGRTIISGELASLITEFVFK